MNIKATVNLNRIPVTYNINDDFVKAKTYHQQHGVEWDYTFKNVDVHGYTSVQVNLPIGTRWVLNNAEKDITLDPNADVNMFVFDEAEWSSSVGSQFPLLPNTPTGDSYLVNGKPFANIATYLYDHNQGLTAVMIMHEWMHCLVKLANLAGFATLDVMDSYYLNSTPDAVNGNFAQQWALLKSFLASHNAQPEVIITRTTSDTKETIGQLITADKKFGCFTLELPDLNNHVNTSHIPAGTYNCVWSYMSDLKEYHYELQGVEGRSGIFIHELNTVSQTQGCIGLGGLLIPDGIENDLGNSRIILTAFETKMAQKPFVLQIK